MKIIYSFLVLFLFSISTLFTQKVISDYTGDGTNARHFVYEYEDLSYLITIAQCDDIEVAIVDESMQKQVLRTVQIVDSYNADILFTEKYVCVGARNAVVALDLINEDIHIGELPDGLIVSRLFDADGEAMLLWLDSEDTDGRYAYYQIGGSLEMLPMGSQPIVFKDGYYLEPATNGGLHSYYVTSFPSLERDTLVFEATESRTFVATDEDLLYFVSSQGYLAYYDRRTREVVDFEFIFPGRPNARMAVKDNKIAFGYAVGEDDYFINVYDLDEEVSLAGHTIEGSHGSPISINSLELAGTTVLAKGRFTGYFYNYETGEIITQGGFKIDNSQTTYTLPNDDILIQTTIGSDLVMSLVKQGTLEVINLEGSIRGFFAERSALVKPGDDYLLMRASSLNQGNIEFVSLDMSGLNSRPEPSLRDASSFGMDRGSLFSHASGQGGVVYSDNIVAINDESVDLLYEGSFSLLLNHRRRLERSDTFVYFNEEDESIWSYDGTHQKILDYSEHNELDGSGSFLNVTDFPQFLLLAVSNKLYTYDKATGVLSETTELSSPILTRGKKWVYYNDVNRGFVRMDKYQQVQEIDYESGNTRDYLRFIQDEVLIYRDSLVFKLNDDGTTQEVYSNSDDFVGDFVTNSSNHIILFGFDGGVHYDGIVFTPYDYKYNTQFVSDHLWLVNDSIYVVNEKELIPFPAALKGEIVGHIRAYGKDYLATKPENFNDGYIRFYETDATFTTVDLLYEASLGNTDRDQSFASASFDYSTFIKLGGKFFTLTSADEVQELPDLQSGGIRFLQKEDRVYFMAYNKDLGNQVHVWYTDMPDAVTTLTQRDVTLFPNPTNHSFTITPSADEWIVYDAAMHKLKKGVGEKVVTSNLIDGMYFIRLRYGDDWITRRFVKTK